LPPSSTTQLSTYTSPSGSIRPLAGRVYDHYIADFETFGHHQNSWRFE
jgi:hypothetical protein